MESRLERLKYLRNEVNLQIKGLDNYPKDATVMMFVNHTCLLDIFYLPMGLPEDIVSAVSARLMYKKDIIPIFFAMDDGYVPFFSVALRSLIDNSSSKYIYDIKILYTSISKENQARIKKNETKNVKIEFVDLTEYIEKIEEKLYTRDYYSKSTS